MPKIVLIQLTHHTYARDFRRPLLLAAAREEGLAIHVECGAVSNLTVVSADGENQGSAWDCLASLRRRVGSYIQSAAPLVLTGVGGAWSPAVMRLASTFEKGLRYYDVQDDLSYGSTGIDYLKFLVRDAAWRFLCPQRVVLELGMQAKYGHAFHLDNASDVEARDEINPDRASSPFVYVGSIDERVDIELLKALLVQHPIDIWGRVHDSGSSVQAALERLAGETRRLRLLGPYDNDELGSILAEYSVGIVPYKAADRLTSHINPDKLYHYLNAGLTVLSSAFPQAVRMQDYLMVIDRDSDLSPEMIASMGQRSQRNWDASHFRWNRRWEQLRGHAHMNRVA